MTLSQWLVILIIVVPIALLLLNKIGMDIAGLIVAVSLGLAQFAGAPILGNAHSPLESVKAISGFGQPVTITLMGLFVLTYGLDKTGVTRWIARSLLRLGGTSEWRLIGLFASTTALLSLVMNNLAAGALVLPTAMEVARRTQIRPSKLLMPVAYGSLLGGVATYFTTANIIISDMLPIAKPSQTPLHFLDFTPTGGLIAIIGIAFLTLFGKKLLPDRAPSAELLMVRPSGSELEERYHLDERLWELQILDSSNLSSKTLAEADIGRQFGITVAAIWRGRKAIFNPEPSQQLMPGDMLLVIGQAERVNNLSKLGLMIGRDLLNVGVSRRGVHFVELMPAPHSSAIGLSLKELGFRKKYGLTAVALWRKDRAYRTNVGDFELALGDSFLMIGPRTKIELLQRNPDFIVLESSSSDEPVQRRGAIIAGGAILAATAVSIAGVPVYLAMLVGAMAVVLLSVMSMDEAYRAVDWRPIFLIAGMYPASVALVQTGIAGLIGQALVHVFSGTGPLGLAAGVFLLSTVLNQFMGGQVTALVTGPIAISAAVAFNTNTHAIAVATAIGCSASFLTPIAHPVNILMMAPANYTFGDFIRVGWWLTVVCFGALLLGMVLFWHL